MKKLESQIRAKLWRKQIQRWKSYLVPEEAGELDALDQWEDWNYVSSILHHPVPVVLREVSRWYSGIPLFTGLGKIIVTVNSCVF